MSEPVLSVRDLVTGFPLGGETCAVVSGVGFDVRAGEVMALVGESGCGKSVTALSILRLVPRPGRIVSGSVRLCGADVLSLPFDAMRRLRGADAAMIFQEPMTSLNPVLRVGAQVVEAIRLHERVSAAEARRRTVDLFERVRIPDPAERVDSFPHQLSGGLKQRVMIAMALAMRPKLLIADEPTTALDVTIQAQVLHLLRELRDELGTAILLITHDLGVVNELSDRIAVMYAGRIVEEGARERVLAHPAHPYTQGLLAAMPAHGRRGEPLREIPGVVPPPREWPGGCAFRARCARALPVCERSMPVAVAVAAGHEVRCHAVAGEGGA